jgi:hypothetical protein
MKKELVSCCHFLFLLKNWPIYRNVNVHIQSRKCQRTHSQFSLIVVWTWGCNFGVGGFFQQKVGIQFRLPYQNVYYYYYFYKGNSLECIHFIANKLKQPLILFHLENLFRLGGFLLTSVGAWLNGNQLQSYQSQLFGLFRHSSD